MFERFTDRARRAVVLAQEEARQLSHNYIGSEHLLLGLIREGDGIAARALESAGIGLNAARAQVEATVGRGKRGPSGHIPFTTRAKKAIELSLRESLQLGTDYIGTEHVLLGIFRVGDSTATAVLVSLGTDLSALRERVLELMRGQPGFIEAMKAQRSGGRLELLDARLAALERWTGMVPEELADLDQAIAQVRRDKELAIDAQDFATAAGLRSQEKELLDEEDRREREPLVGPSLADEVARLRAQVEGLAAALRRHGIDPGEDQPGGKPGDEVAG